jgi:hypothetical protein
MNIETTVTVAVNTDPNSCYTCLASSDELSLTYTYQSETTQLTKTIYFDSVESMAEVGTALVRASNLAKDSSQY